MEPFRAAYVDRAATSLCAMLLPAAQTELEVQVSRDHCAIAATKWFTTAEYDRPAAAEARLVWVHVQGAYALTSESDPNSPADPWVRTRRGVGSSLHSCDSASRPCRRRRAHLASSGEDPGVLTSGAYRNSVHR